MTDFPETKKKLQNLLTAGNLKLVEIDVAVRLLLFERHSFHFEDSAFSHTQSFRQNLILISLGRVKASKLKLTFSEV